MDTKNNTIQAVRNTLVMRVLDKYGLSVQSGDLEIINTIWPEIPALKGILREVVVDGETRLMTDEMFIRAFDLSNGYVPQPKMFSPMQLKGKTYKLAFWGSSVKEGKVVYATEGTLVKLGFMTEAEQAYRVMRHLMPRGDNGAIKGTLKVLVVKPGMEINGLLIEDGFGAIARDVYEAGKMGRESQLGHEGMMTYSFWQHFRWTDLVNHGTPDKPILDVDTQHDPLWKEIEPDVRESLAAVNNPSYQQLAAYASAKGRDRFIEANPDAAYHPALSSFVMRTRARLISRLAQAPQIENYVFVAVPSKSDLVWPGGDEKAIYFRQPIANKYGIGACDHVVTSGPEADRIAGMEVLQITATTTDLRASFKLQVQLADREMLNGYDMILCTEDAKMGTAWQEYRQPGEFEQEMVVTFMRHWAAGSAFGINARVFKTKSGDHDGDDIFAIPASKYPVLFERVKEFGEGAHMKLEKTHSPITGKSDNRPAQAAVSMRNIVGNITNFTGELFSLYDDEADLERVASFMGFKSAQTLLEHVARIHKLGEDIFKLYQDPTRDISWMAAARNIICGQFDARAPHTHWKGDEDAFLRRLPKVIDVDEATDEWDRVNGVSPYTRGFVARYSRLVLGSIDLHASVETKPLSAFATLALEPEDPAVLHSAEAFNTSFKMNLARTNQMDPEAWNHFVTIQTARLDKWIAKHFDGDHWMAANALWFASHSEQRSGGSVVFVLMPDEAERILREKPGLAQLEKRQAGKPVAVVNVTGLEYQFTQKPPVLFQVKRAVVAEFTQVKDGKKTLRKAILGDGSLPHQVQPQDPQYPLNMIALLDKQHSGTPCGQYDVVFQNTGKVWKAEVYKSRIH
jgi:hypothetical protein